VRRGGAVTVVIVAVGILALVIAIQKLFDFRRLAGRTGRGAAGARASRARSVRGGG
jgi:hypothetical protein